RPPTGSRWPRAGPAVARVHSVDPPLPQSSSHCSIISCSSCTRLSSNESGLATDECRRAALEERAAGLDRVFTEPTLDVPVGLASDRLGEADLTCFVQVLLEADTGEGRR